MTQSSAAKADRKVKQIISRGADPEIVDEGYERRRALEALKDYASHPRSTDLVRERAEAALTQLSDETTEEGEQ